MWRQNYGSCYPLVVYLFASNKQAHVHTADSKSYFCAMTTEQLKELRERTEALRRHL